MAFSACQCQVESGPLSSPTRTTFGALVSMASGVEAHWPRQTVFPLLSMTHRWVVCCDTSRPTYCSIAQSPCMVLEGKLAPPSVPRYGARLWNRCFYEGTICSAITPCVPCEGVGFELSTWVLRGSIGR